MPPLLSKPPNITASVVTNSSGQQELAFSSSTAAFSVTSGDVTASALMGSFSAGAVGNAAGTIAEVASGSTELATAGGERRGQYRGPVGFCRRYRHTERFYQRSRLQRRSTQPPA